MPGRDACGSCSHRDVVVVILCRHLGNDLGVWLPVGDAHDHDLSIRPTLDSARCGTYPDAMCGRFAMDKDTDDMIQEFVAAGGDFREWRPSYSIAPTNRAPIVRATADEDGSVSRTIDSAVWDFPRSPYSKVKGPSINATYEKLTSTWAGPFASRRCIVPMTGYYEWTGPKTDRQPHFIHGPAGKNGFTTLAAAGMYAVEDSDKGQRIRFVIITREGIDASGELHDRMPVFLTPDTWEEWLNPASFTPPNARAAVVAEHRERKVSALATLDRSSAAVSKTITTYMVDKKVNSVQKIDPRDPTLIDPLPPGDPAAVSTALF